jgi:protein associated with RNAse G/E
VTGEQVVVRFTKWGDRPHWVIPTTRLGRDEHGTWLGFRVGTSMARPGLEIVAATASVLLIPDDSHFVASFTAPTEPDEIAVYVDIATPATWADGEVTMVDLDLDVIRRVNGHVFVDDEDEFAEHQVRFGYPAEVVAAAQESCAAVLDAVTRRLAPFDGVSDDWMARLLS